MPDAFDMLGEATTTDKGTIYDYPASTGEAFVGGLERALDTNPLAVAARALRTFDEDFRARFVGDGDNLVDQKTAQAEIASRGLDIKVPMGGMTRYELDTLQYLKQREVRQNTVAARADGALGVAAGFAGGLAGSFTDPINVASNFIPFVSEYRYARWLAQAGTSTLGRAAVRVGAGAIEGAAGAAVLEPLVYAGATSLQLDYDSTDSFLNVTLGGVMGGGLHTIGGAVYDARVSRAMRGLDQGIVGNAGIRDALAALPEMQQRELFQAAVAAAERGEAFDAEKYLDLWHGSPHVFDKFDLAKVGSENNANFGHGVYLASVEQVAGRFQGDVEGQGHLYKVRVSGSADEFLDWSKPLAKQSAVVTAALNKVLGPSAAAADVAQLPSGRWVLKHGEEIVGRKDGWPTRGDAITSKEMLDEKRAKSVEALIIDNKTGLPRPGGDKLAKSLRDAGIKGITYGHQALPGDGGGSSNFVVFDPSDLQIISRNGEPIARPSSGPRTLSDLIPQARADRTQEAFDRQFVEDGRAPAPRPEPKDQMERAKVDYETAADVIEEFRKEGRVLADEEKALKDIDDAVKRAELEAQAFEAAAACMVAA